MNTFKNVLITTGATLVLLGAIFIFAFSLPVSANFNDGIFSVHSASYAVAQGDSGGGDSGGDSGGGDSGGDSGGGDSGGDSGGGDSGGDSGGGDSGGDSGGGDSGGDSGGGDSGGDSGGGDSGGSTGDGGGDGGGGDGGGSPSCPAGYTGVYPNCIPPQQPSCVISAYPNQIVIHEDPLLTWSSSNATSANLSSVGSVPVNGTYNVFPTQTTTYTLTVSGPGGTAQCHTTVTVIVVQDPPTCSISAYPNHIVINEDPTLTWTSSSGVVSASLNQGIGSVPVNGSYNVFPHQTTTYTLTVYKANGQSAQCSTTITVTHGQPACEIWADPQAVQSGGSVLLDWWADNATSATINQGIGAVDVGGFYILSSVTMTKTYTMTVTGQGGTAQCSTTVTVVQDEPDAPACDIWAGDTSIYTGESTTLHWDSSNATSASLSGVGSVSVDGSRSTGALYTTTTYTLTVSGSGGTAQCQVTIGVLPDEESSMPSCALSANPTTVQQGGSSTLTWSSQNATSAFLSSSGAVSVNGNQSVSPNGTTHYLLTVYNAFGQSAQCSTTVTVTSAPTCPSGYSGTYPNCVPPCNNSCGHSGGSTDVVNNNNNENYNTNNISNNSNSSSNNTNNVTINVPAPVVNNVYPSFPGYPGYQQPQYPNYPYPQYNQAPYCTITLSNHYGSGYNQRTLNWYSTNANSAYITEIGSVPSSGSRAVWGDEYTMTVYGPGGTATCRTGNAYVPPPVYYPPVNNYPPVFHPIATAQQHPIAIAHVAPQAPIVRHVAAPLIALNQIPYTGFGFGEFGTAMYWLSIVMVAALGAGALVHFRSDMFSFAGVSSMFKKESRSARLQEFLREESLSFTPTRLLGIR